MDAAYRHREDAMEATGTGRPAEPTVKTIAADQPWLWLQRGWGDLVAMPGVSLGYGAAIVCLSWILAYALWISDSTWMVLPMAGGFLLIAPFIALGLYEASSAHAAGLPISMRATLRSALRRPHIAAFGVVLLLLHLAWMRGAMLWFLLYFHAGTPPLDQLPVYLLQAQNLPFLIVGTAMGGMFALATFAISVVTLPIMLDRRIDVVSAMFASLRCVFANPKAMALWAGLIAVFTCMGLATLFFGLGLLFPLIAHASWHAYRDLID
jgi:uncharacterized membrane protein